MVLRSPIVIKGTLVDGTGDPLLTRDATTQQVGTVASLGSGFVSSTLASGNIIVGNGSNVATSVAMSGDGTISNTGVFAIASGVIVNADVNASAAIAYSKLNLTGGIVNADVNASAAIVYSKLSLSNSILNADINSAAAIARTKIASGNSYRILANNASGVLSENAAITASRAIASDSNGQLVASATTATQLGYLSTTTSDVQTQINTIIAGKPTNAVLQSPTVTQDGYAITWDNAAQEYTLTDPVTQGIPVGGSTRQFLGKNTGTNYDASWLTLQLSDITNVSASASDLNLLNGQQASGLTSTHISYLIGATSNIQSQLNTKLSSTLAQNAIFVGNASNVASSVAAGSEGQVLTITSGVPTWQTIVGTGTVTSVNVSGGTTGLSFTGGPITTTGTITASGTLAVANGGTGLTALGTALQYLRVNAGGTALEYTTVPGGVSGSTGSVDNAVLRADGTGGSTLQSSALVVTDTASIDLGINAVTTGSTRIIEAKGSSANISINILAKGAGGFLLAGSTVALEGSTAVSLASGYSEIVNISSSVGGELRFQEGSVNGANYVALKSPNSLSATTTYTLPLTDGTSGQVLSTNGSGILSWITAGGGSGDVVGPASATDNAVARFDTTTGKLIQNSSFIVSDTSDVVLGVASTTGSSRNITVDGSTPNINLLLNAKGSTGSVIISNANNLATFSTSAGAPLLTMARGNSKIVADREISGSTTVGFNLIVSGGDVGTSAANLDGGHLFLKGGLQRGTGRLGNVGFFTTSLSNWQNAQDVLFIQNRVADPSAAITNGIVLYSKDSSDGSANSTLALYTEQVPEVTTTFTQTHRLKVWINNVEYYLSLDAV